MECRRVRALSARTEFVPGYGQVHFDPSNSNDDIRLPLVPEAAIAGLVAKGWIADDIAPAADADPEEPEAGDPADGPVSLAGKNKHDLLAIADEEGVEADETMTNKAIVEAIEAARAASGAGEEGPPV